jgi:acyl-CoA thioester hydrolase
MDRYTKTLTVRWGDCDANGHVRNTVYDEYGVETRLAYFADQGFGYPRMREHRIGPVIFREEIDYLREIGIGETIEIDLCQLGSSPDGAKWKFAHEITKQDGTKAARIVLSGGWMDLDTRKITPAPPALAAAMRNVPRDAAFEELPPLGSSKKKG